MDREKMAIVLYSRAKARAHFYSHNFARYLAIRNPGPPQKAKELWAHYKLGKYRTVAQASLTSHNRRALMATVVSAAACNQHDLLQQSLESLKASRLSNAQRLKTACSLAAFAPKQALSLIEPGSKTALEIALQAWVGDLDTAREQLKQRLASGSRGSGTESALLSINLLSDSHRQSLDLINQLLSNYQLEPITTQQPDQPASPAHFHCDPPTRRSTGPLVSVIMTTFNSAPRVENALRSLWQQTYENLEIIIVDDCSSDSTCEHVKELIKGHANTRLLQLPINAGPYVAKTAGLVRCQGEFITCHDSDDWSHPRKIERQVLPLLNNPQLVATTSEWVRLSDAGNTYARSVYPLLRLNPSSLLFRRTRVLGAMGSWDLVRTGADSELIARLRASFGRRALRAIHEPLAFGAHRHNSLMTASDTGMDTGAIHADRMAYWEAWSDWHIQSLAASQAIQFTSTTAERPFAVPAAIDVAPEIVRRCLQEALGQDSDAALNAIGLKPA